MKLFLQVENKNKRKKKNPAPLQGLLAELLLIFMLLTSKFPFSVYNFLTLLKNLISLSLIRDSLTHSLSPTLFLHK